MKTFLVVVMAALVATVALADDDWYPCNSDYDCEWDECCVEDRFSRDGYKICRDKGDDPGDLCGGRYYCGCERGYICRPHPAERRNSPWFQWSNGSCHFDYDAYYAVAGTRNAALRRGYRPDFDDLDDIWDDRRRR